LPRDVRDLADQSFKLRLLPIGYFEALDAEHATAWRAARFSSAG
jgi:hypothetical protein